MKPEDIYPTGGEIIRELKKYYVTSDEVNNKVGSWRRQHGSKNWISAAFELLLELKKGGIKC